MSKSEHPYKNFQKTWNKSDKIYEYWRVLTNKDSDEVIGKKKEEVKTNKNDKK